MSNIIVSGAGSAALNGIYAPDGTINGGIRYTKDGGYPTGCTLQFNGSGTWHLLHTGGNIFYSSAGFVGSVPTAGWTNAGGIGINPPPSVSGSSSSESSESSSSEDIDLPAPEFCHTSSFIGPSGSIPSVAYYNRFVKAPDPWPLEDGDLLTVEISQTTDDEDFFSIGTIGEGDTIEMQFGYSYARFAFEGSVSPPALHTYPEGTPGALDIEQGSESSDESGGEVTWLVTAPSGGSFTKYQVYVGRPAIDPDTGLQGPALLETSPFLDPGEVWEYSGEFEPLVFRVVGYLPEPISCSDLAAFVLGAYQYVNAACEGPGVASAPAVVWNGSRFTVTVPALPSGADSIYLWASSGDGSYLPMGTGSAGDTIILPPLGEGFFVFWMTYKEAFYDEYINNEPGGTCYVRESPVAYLGLPPSSSSSGSSSSDSSSSSSASSSSSSSSESSSSESSSSGSSESSSSDSSDSSSESSSSDSSSSSSSSESSSSESSSSDDPDDGWYCFSPLGPGTAVCVFHEDEPTHPPAWNVAGPYQTEIGCAEQCGGGGSSDLPEPPPPVVTILSATSARVAGIAFDALWEAVNLRHWLLADPSDVTSQAVVENTPIDLTGLLTNQPYVAQFFAQGGGLSAAGPTTGFTPSEDGGPSSPDAPGEVRIVRLTATTARVEMPALPANANYLRLIFGDGTLIQGNLAGGALVLISGLTPETDYTVRARSVNLFGTTDGPDLLFTTESEDDQCEGGDVPDTPNPPTATKMCAVGKINVVAPVWAEEPEVTSMELRRRVNAGSGFGSWSTIHTWVASGGSYLDEDVEAFSVYEYAVRALNGAGESAWSTAASVTLQSSTLSITFNLPVASPTTIAKKKTIRVTLTDSAEETDPCGAVTGVGPCALSAPDLTAYLDGLELPGTWVNVSGTPRNGVWELEWDTRDYANGTRTLKVTAIGCDCCLSRATRTVATLNTLRNDVGYIEIKRTKAPATGWQYEQAAVLLQNEPLSENPARRFWVKSAVATTNPATDWEDSGITAALKSSAFDAMQRITMRQGEVQEAAELIEMHAEPLLAPAGNAVHFVLQLTPEQVVSAWLTGCERVAKIEWIKDGEYLVFADSPVGGDEAKAFRFTYDDLELLADLSDHGAGDAFDVALLNDKLFVIAPDELFAVDLDSGQATLNLSPRGETRAPFAVVTANDKILAFFVDEELEEERTRCYDMTFAAPRLLWSLDEAIGKVRWLNNALLVTTGAVLLSTTNVSNAPVEVETFGAAITALGADAARFYVGLANGEVWRLAEDNWTNEVELSGAVAAVGAWEGSGLTEKGVAGLADDAHLTEELLGGSWIDAREMTAPAGSEEAVSGITALERFTKTLSPQIGTPGEPGFIEEEKIVSLLLGTGEEGVLLMLELSDIDELQGAFKASEPSHLGLCAYQGVVPVE